MYFFKSKHLDSQCLNPDIILATINVNKDTSSKSINGKPIGIISYQCLHGYKNGTMNASTRTQSLDNYASTRTQS